MKEAVWYGVTYYRPTCRKHGLWTFFVHTYSCEEAYRIAERVLGEDLTELLLGVYEVVNPDQKISLTKRVGDKENAYINVKGESIE